MPIVRSFYNQFPEFKGVKIEIRHTDGYFDATAMNQALGKRFSDWRKTKFAKKLLARLSDRTGIPIDWDVNSNLSVTPLIDYIPGDEKIWLSPYVALSYAMSDPEFQADVNIWIIDHAILGTVNPHILKWTREEYERGLQYNRDDIREIYGR